MADARVGPAGQLHVIGFANAHCEGEVGRVLTHGLPPLPGTTPLEVLRHINEVDDTWRRLLVEEPHGNVLQSTNLILPPTVAGADAGMVVLQPDMAHAMSGSNAICVVTALVGGGKQSHRPGEFTLETAAGLVTATVTTAGDRVTSVSLDMVPAFAERLEIVTDVPGVGQVNCDLAFGGIYYLLVDADRLGVAIKPANARRLVTTGRRIMAHCAATVSPAHPTIPELNRISYVMFCGTDDAGDLVGATVMAPGRIDRSPCGTGNAARMAVRHARGEVAEGATVTARSITGGAFTVTHTGTSKFGGHDVVHARVTGQATVYGREELWIDPDAMRADAGRIDDLCGADDNDVS